MQQAEPDATRQPDKSVSEGTSVLSLVQAMLADADRTALEVGYPGLTLRDAYHRQVTMLLAQAYVQVFGTSVENPDWVPHTGPMFPWGAPNHDTIYGFAPMDAKGIYRVSGRQGTETVASLMFRKGGANNGQMHGATLGEIDVQAIDTGEDRRFSVLISAERPDGHTGPWHALPPETTGLVARHVTERPEQQDGIWTLERLDRAPASMVATGEELTARALAMTSFVRKLNEFLLRRPYQCLCGRQVPGLRWIGRADVLPGPVRVRGRRGFDPRMCLAGVGEILERATRRSVPQRD
jgi:hypothetical protein